jgi:hypothetical protein
MLLVTSSVQTVLSISQNGMNQITSNKRIDNHLNEDIINASISLSSFLFVDASIVQACLIFMLWNSLI